jgi:diguanylate cyclase (GGDEF)-like protein
MQRLRKNMSSPELNEISLATYEARYQAVIANAPIILSALNARGNFIFSDGRGLASLRQEFTDITDNRIGRSVFEIYRDYPDLLSDIQRAQAGEALMVQHDLGSHTFEIQLTPAHNAKGQVMGVISVATDVTERARAERALWHQAHYDSVTDLPNQTLLRECLMQELQTDRRTNVALLMMDLNRFREINDTFGHQYGDDILQQVGKRLSCTLGPSATIARADGDEFVILLPGADEEEAQEAVATICDIFEQPFLIQGFPLHVEAGIGIALSSPTHETNFLALLRQADVAMHIARSKRKAYVFYHPDLDPYTPRRLSILGALRSAIANGELTLFYQPQVNLQTGITHSVEALLRWNHPEHGCIPPDQFIPLAEQTGLIKPLTLWVLEAAIQQCVNWLHQGISLSVSVNLSTWNLREVDLPDKIAVLLAHYALPAHYLCVEVTESAVISEIEHAAEILNRICEMGIKVAVDDFGTGYSSFAYLKHLPVHELKIDCLFVKEMINNPLDATIVQSTVAMGRNLGLRVVAEGVEDQETADRLTDYGCDTAQGYYWARPLPAQELERWLEETRTVAMI